MNSIKLFSWFFIIILVVNLVLFSFRIINSTFFWIIIIVGAFVSFLIKRKRVN